MVNQVRIRWRKNSLTTNDHRTDISSSSISTRLASAHAFWDIFTSTYTYVCCIKWRVLGRPSMGICGAVLNCTDWFHALAVTVQRRRRRLKRLRRRKTKYHIFHAVACIMHPSYTHIKSVSGYRVCVCAELVACVRYTNTMMMWELFQQAD